MPATPAARPLAAAIASMSSVEVLVASTACGWQSLAELRENLLLDRQVLEYSLDHEIGACERLQVPAES